MKHQCRKAEKLSMYIDGELSQKEHENLSVHIDQCDICSRELSALRQTDELLSSVSDINPSADFDRILWNKIASESERNSWWRFGNLFQVWKLSAATALAALVIGVVVLTDNPGRLSDERALLIAENLEMLDDYEVVNSMELLENWDILMSMSEGDS